MKDPILDIMPWGKYKDFTFSDIILVDRDYLDWLLTIRRKKWNSTILEKVRFLKENGYF